MALITVEQIKRIKPGKPEFFGISHPRQIKSARTMCSYVGINYPELGLRFSLKQNHDRTAVIITAHKI